MGISHWKRLMGTDGNCWEEPQLVTFVAFIRPNQGLEPALLISSIELSQGLEFALLISSFGPSQGLEPALLISSIGLSQVCIADILRQA